MKLSDIIELVFLAGIALILALSFSFGFNLILNTDTPQVAVTTRSMTPTYWGFYDSDGYPEQTIGPFTIPVYWLRGDLLLIQGVSPESLKVGDVIVFDDPTASVGIPVVHRIVSINMTGSARFFLTKGDDNRYSDSDEIGGNRFGWISEEDVHGKVVFRVPHVGWLSLQIQRLEVRLMLLLIAVLLLILSFAGDDEKEKGNEKDKSRDERKEKLENGKTVDTGNVDGAGAKQDQQGPEEPVEDVTAIDRRVEGGKKDAKRSFNVRLASKAVSQKFFEFVKGPVTFEKITAGIFLAIVALFAISASLNYLGGQCGVKIMMRDEDVPINDWDVINYSPHNSYVFEKWSSRTSTTGYSVYSYNIDLAITSRGFLNWVSSVEVETNTTSNGQDDNLYRWTVVYDFHGTKNVNGCIKMYLPDNQPPTWIQVTVRAKTSGLLNQGTLEWQYQIQVGTLSSESQVLD